MQNLKKFSLLALFSLLIISCDKEEDIVNLSPNPTQSPISNPIQSPDSNTVTLEGTLELLGPNIFMYGSHRISSGAHLTSNTINLEDYENQQVTIIGHPISGYPINSGDPILIEVTAIR
jgi:hypothetical protein